MTTDQSFYSAQDQEAQNTSLLSYTQHANEKSAIGENNLRLNIVMNILVIISNCFLFLVDWFHHTSLLEDKGALVSSESKEMSFYVSILSVRVEPSNTEMDTNDFLAQCEDA